MSKNSGAQAPTARRSSTSQHVRRRHTSSSKRPRSNSRDRHQPWEVRQYWDSKENTLNTKIGQLRCLIKDSKSLMIDLSWMTIDNQRLPESHCITCTTPNLREHLDRTRCMSLFKRLSEREIRINLRLEENKEEKLTRKFLPGDKEEEKVDLATVLILSVALRGAQHSQVAELIGLSQPLTIKNISRYVRSHWIKWSTETISELIHASARNVTQPREEHGNPNQPGKPGSLMVLRNIPIIIAELLANASLDITTKSRAKDSSAVKDLTEESKALFGRIFEGNRRLEQRDRGIKAGLVLAGIRMWFRAVTQGNSKTTKRIKVVLEVIFGALSGVPTGGFVFSATYPIVARILERRNEKQEAHFDQVWEEILEVFMVKEDEIFPRNSEGDLQRLESYWTWKRAALDG